MSVPAVGDVGVEGEGDAAASGHREALHPARGDGERSERSLPAPAGGGGAATLFLSSRSAANGATTENAPVDGQNYVSGPCFEIRAA